MNKTFSYNHAINISDELWNIASKCELQLHNQWKEIEEIEQWNQLKVLSAFKEEKIADYHFSPSSGYGYGDVGRDALERVFAHIMGGEDALVRSNIVSGTHAISLGLYGCLRPGDCLLSVMGKPYDTLEEIIGIRGRGQGSLKDYGIDYCELALCSDGTADLVELENILVNKSIKMVLIQRSRGYSWDRQALTIPEIEYMIRIIKRINKEIICFVDNCYGEFIEDREPTQVGADLMAGSLIKNPGGGISPTGGYLVGNRDLIELAANRLSAPGIGQAVGSNPMGYRLYFQGLFMSPHTVAQALKGAVFVAKICSELGYEVSPTPDNHRGDLIQCIKFGDATQLIHFCQGIQGMSPIDSYVVPHPSGIPGYEDQVIMAAGTFIQGATLELSADAPIRSPYVVYLQGGLTYNHVKLGTLSALHGMEDVNNYLSYKKTLGI